MNARAVKVEGRRLTLRAQDYVAAGGQGHVYARDGVAYKIFSDVAAMPSPQKLQELRALASPAVAAPQSVVCDGAGAPIGVTMPFIADAVSWAQLCTPAFRRRARLSDAAAIRLVDALAAALHAVHGHGAAVVDLSENNVLVRRRCPHLIDVDSWQTRSFPATALTPAIACPRAAPGTFDAGTDWFAFAVLSFMLLIGIHPFKGKHPAVRGLAARMNAGLSVLDPAVRTPPATRDLRTLPPQLRDWYDAVFRDGERKAPPRANRPAAAPPPRAPSLRLIHRYPAPTRHVMVDRGCIFAATATAAFQRDQPWLERATDILALARTTTGAPYVLDRGDDDVTHVHVFGCTEATPVPLQLHAWVSVEGRVFGRSGARLVELDVRVLGSRPVVLIREVARVLPAATQLFPGVALQSVLGRWHASWLGLGAGTPQTALPMLDEQQVVDARRCGETAVILTRREGAGIEHYLQLDARGQVVAARRSIAEDGWGTAFCQASGVRAQLDAEGLKIASGARRQRLRVASGPTDAMLHTDGSRIVLSLQDAVWALEPAA